MCLSFHFSFIFRFNFWSSIMLLILAFELLILLLLPSIFWDHTCTTPHSFCRVPGSKPWAPRRYNHCSTKWATSLTPPSLLRFLMRSDSYKFQDPIGFWNASRYPPLLVPNTLGLNILSPHTAGALTSWLLGYYFWESKLLWHREWIISTHTKWISPFFFIFGRYRHHSLDNGEMCVSLWKLMFQWIGHPKEEWTCEGVCPPIGQSGIDSTLYTNLQSFG